MGDLLNIHHVKSVEDGGEGWFDNLIALCPNCHAFIHLAKREKTKSGNLFPGVCTWIKDAYPLPAALLLIALADGTAVYRDFKWCIGSDS